mmetsp:Transcript_21327/g.31358  ORF Transcript_21327/g.31358 Transcript_21327/m.31358 type:complete len:278 (+) Transcript_21327:143-976(+)
MYRTLSQHALRNAIGVQQRMVSLEIKMPSLIFSRINNTSSSENVASTPFMIARRDFGIRTKRKNMSRRTVKQDKTPKLLSNEVLIRTLFAKNKGATADSIEVRLLVDQGLDTKDEISVMTLTEAISRSVEESKDLIGININHDVPIIKCMEVNRFKYQQKKKSPGKGNTNKATKQFSFKAGIDDNDLQRKAGNMISYLQKGHASQLTVSSSRRNLNFDKNAIMTTLNRIIEFVGENGKLQGEIKMNEYGNRGNVLIQPDTGSKKKNRTEPAQELEKE